jgi:hypothetical protein
MFEKIVNGARAVAGNLRKSRVAQVVGMSLMSASAFAQTAGSGDIDTSDMLTKIGEGVAAGLVISVAYTAAVIGIRASKLPRKAA